MKYTLKKPIKIGEGTPITELVFREEVKAGDWRGIHIRSEPLYDDMFKIAGRLCAQPDKVMDNLGHEDMQAVLELVASFLGIGQATGQST